MMRMAKRIRTSSEDKVRIRMIRRIPPKTRQEDGDQKFVTLAAIFKYKYKY